MSCQYVKYWFYMEASHQTLSNPTGSANISPWKFIKIHTGICSSHTNVWPSGQLSVSIHSLFITNNWSIHISALDGSVFPHTDTGVHGHPAQDKEHVIDSATPKQIISSRKEKNPFKTLQYYVNYEKNLSAGYFCRVVRNWSFPGRNSVRGKIH